MWLQGRDLPPRAEARGFGRAAHKTANATKTNDSEDWLRGPATIWIWSSRGQRLKRFRPDIQQFDQSTRLRRA